MTTTLLSILLLVPVQSDSTTPFHNLKDRERHPLAPSLPLLTEVEEKILDHVIDRFMLADVGKLRGLDARKALIDFQQLSSEAIPALIRGINRAAEINDSCPVIVIAKKLDQLLRVSDDKKLLQYARDEIGAGVGRTRHASVLKDLRVKVTFRQNAVTRVEDDRKRRTGKSTSGSPGESLDTSPAGMSVEELAKAVEAARGRALTKVLDELGKRDGDDALSALAAASKSIKEKKNLQFARELLVKSMTRQDETAIKKHLSAEMPELRGAAIFAVYKKKLPYIDELIGLLDDDEEGVRRLAVQALVKLTSKNFGPPPGATSSERKKAVEAWKVWRAKKQ